LDGLFGLISPVAWLRIKANITFPFYSVTEYPLHCDLSVEQGRNIATTALFYLTDTNGGTVFEDGTVVECRAGRLVTFPASYRHAAQTYTQGKIRCVVNMNYIQSANPSL